LALSIAAYSPIHTNVLLSPRTICLLAHQTQSSFVNPQDQWLDLYPTIVSKAGLFDVLSTGGDDGSRDRALQLMYTETHALSPLVPTRGVNFLRYCCKVNEGVWVVVDSSVDGLRDFARKGDVSAFTLVYWLEVGGRRSQRISAISGQKLPLHSLQMMQGDTPL
jgi:hypothetical protein